MKKLWVGIVMTARAMLRSRISIILLLLIPALFYTIVALTTTERKLEISLASVSGGASVEVSERSESLIFIGAAAVGFLASFLALRLVQRSAESNRRLVLCGFHPALLVLGKLAVLVMVSVVLGCYVAGMLPLFMSPERFLLVATGFVLAGCVYGCYGLLVGSIFRRELEGILFVALLANIDAGWLQNPLYYAGAQNQFIIRILPAYFPSQVSLAAAFTGHPVSGPVLGSLLYAVGLLAAALLAFFLRMKTWR